MIRDAIFLTAMGAFLYCLPYIARADIWSDACGVGFFVPDLGGYYLAWGACNE